MTAASQKALAAALLEPAAVAVVGASGDAEKTAGRPLLYLRKHGFTGQVYPVNPGRKEVMGERAYSHVSELPPVDHAFIVLPTGPAMAAVEDCARHGVKVVSILANGFAEAGPEGLERQRRLERLARDTGCRILGPNSLGLVRTPNNLLLTANAAFAQQPPLRGRYAVLSQSGSMIGTFGSRGRPRGTGFSTLVSVGNEADLSLGEIGAALVDDPETDAFLLFLETIRRPDMLERFADAAARAGKPILAYKLGRSQVGSELAVSHTGALVGSDAAAGCLLSALGITRVDLFETLLEAPPLAIASARRPRRPAVATVVTTTGGGGAMVADRLGMHGVEVRGMGAAGRARLAQKGIEVTAAPIIDVTMAGADYATMRAILDELLQDESIGVVVPVLGSSSEIYPERVVRPIIDAVHEAKSAGPPVAAFTVPQADAALSILQKAGIAGFRTPEACADAVVALLARKEGQRPAAGARVDAAIFDVLPVRPNEQEALAAFEALSIPVVERVVLPLDGVHDDADRLPPFPVVAKLLSRQLPHKTEAGAVTMGITSREQLRTAVAGMVKRATAHSPAAVIDGVLVQRQCAAVGEALLGFHRDPNVGPVVTVGAGGTMAEIYRDVAIRLAPVSPQEARRMIDEVAGFASLKGYRGRPRGDVDALATAVAHFSRLAALPRIREAEINPLLVLPEGDGVVAVDGLIVCND